jgi:NTE family protein
VQFGRTGIFATELYQPLSVGGRWYVQPRVSFVRRPIDIYLEGQRVGQTAVSTAEAALSLGWQAPIGDFRGTLAYGYRDATWEFGPPLLPDYSGRFASAALAFDIDQLDAPLFPRKGYSLSLRGQAARDVLGGNEDWNKLELIGRAAYSIGPHTFEAGLRLGDSPGGPLPIWEAYSLGGFLNLTGYPLDRFIGSRLEYGRVSYYNEFMTLPSPFGSGLYAGLLVEGGRVTEPTIPGSPTSWQPALGAFVGAKTGIGPVFLGFGIGRDGNSAAYVFLGMPR